MKLSNNQLNTLSFFSGLIKEAIPYIGMQPNRELSQFPNLFLGSIQRKAKEFKLINYQMNQSDLELDKYLGKC